MGRTTTTMLTAWANAQGAVCEFWFGNLYSFDSAERLRAFSQLSGTLGEIAVASTKAMLESQVDLARACAERVAADPRSTKLVVEGAHQAYDLVVAFTEATAATCDASLAIVRIAEPARASDAVLSERR